MQYYWRKDTKYYKLIIQPDLLGGTSVICIWGRLNTSRGGYKVISCNNNEEIGLTIDMLEKRRKNRGYIRL